MMNERVRIVSLDVSEIEDGVVQKKCFACGQRQYKYTLVIPVVDNFGENGIIKTKNSIGVCINPKCFRGDDPSISPSWVKDEREA